MKTQLELTKTFYPEQLYIQLSEEKINNAWSRVEKYANDIIKWRAYLNYLIIGVIPELASWLNLEEEKLSYDRDILAKTLEFVNGVTLTLGQTRLVVIPSDIGGDLCVSPELVGTPNLAGDYYLAVQVNADEKWLRFLGFCSHKKLTMSGVYDELTRNYYLDKEDLIDDLDVISMAEELCRKVKTSKFNNTKQIYLKFAPEDVQESYPILDKYPSNGARNRALLNQLSIKVLMTKLASELPLPQNEKLTIRDEIDHTKIWEFFNGSALSLGSTSIVIIPEEIADRDSELEELSVPQEWVDIPNLAASYYIPVQINLDEEYLVIKGYCTHQQLKKGRYKKITREYAIDEDQLINDLSIMLDAIQIEADEKDTISPLKPLSEVEVKNLMREVGESDFYSPRLRISSEKWLPFLANKLSVVNDQKNDVPVNLISKVINLSKWLAKDFSETIKTGWQSLEDILVKQPSFSPAFRGAAFRAEAVKMGKLIKLGDYAVILRVDVSPDEGNEVKVILALYPAQEQSILPENLKVRILEQGETVEILAKEHPKGVIQEMFYLPNEEFSVEFTLNSEIFIESFAI